MNEKKKIKALWKHEFRMCKGFLIAGLISVLYQHLLLQMLLYGYCFLHRLVYLLAFRL